MDIEALRERIGELSPPGGWVTISQQMIDEFAELTGDYQWIHLDRERCEKESPYGTTVAHGMLIQSLIPKLLGDGPNWMEGFSAGINLGSDRVRFMAPVRSGSRIRCRWSIAKVKDAGNGAVRIVTEITIEIEGETKPACHAGLVGILYP